ncbi:MAG: protein kinase [Gemmatimonadetes bacterium]|nr:protein kinase [Gemmatimonadota bacterium]
MSIGPSEEPTPAGTHGSRSGSANSAGARWADLRRALAGRYEIERELGAGGMARVFLAQDLRHDRKVALKVLREGARSGAAAMRFENEIAVVARLNHPNILPLLDSGCTGGINYFVMPVVEGRTLREILSAEGPLSIERAVGYTVEICEALAYAHGRGVVHRDITPSNVLIWEDRVRVCDFGVALVATASPEERVTSTGIAVGSPRYMSPEQRFGDVVDHRSDLFSVGLLLREMLTGSPGGELESGAHRADSAHLDQVLKRALSTRPEDRHATAKELIADLRGALSKRAWWQRSSGAAGAIGLFAVIVAGVWLVAQQRSMSSPGSIAVLPFENLSSAPDLDAVGTMTADWLARGLERTDALEVVPTAATLSLTDVPSVPPTSYRALRGEIAEVTGAELVVSGAVYTSGDRLIVRSEIFSRDGDLLVTFPESSARLDDPMAAIIEVEGRVTGWVSTRLDERLTDHLSGSMVPPTLSAYKAWAAGMDRYLKRDNSAALESFLSAHRQDSTFATALVYASICLTNLGRRREADSLLNIAAASRQLMGRYDRAWLDYQTAAVRGRSMDALEAIRRAAAIAPGTKAVYNHAAQAFISGYVHEAISALESLDPRRGPMLGFHPYWDLLTSSLHLAERHGDEVRIARSSLGPDRLIGLVGLVRAAAAAGDLESVETHLDAARILPQDPASWTFGDVLIEAAEEANAHGHPAGPLYLRADQWYSENSKVPRGNEYLLLSAYRRGAWALLEQRLDSMTRADADPILTSGYRGLLQASTGSMEDAERIALRLAGPQPEYSLGRPAVFAARIAAVLGEEDLALNALGTAFSSGLPYGLWIHRDPDLSSLADPRIVQLLSPRD